MDSGIRVMAFAGSGQLHATGDLNGVVRLHSGDQTLCQFDIAAFESEFDNRCHIRGLAFRPGEDQIYVAAGTAIRAFCTRTFRLIWEARMPPTLGFLTASPSSLDVSIHGRVLGCFNDGSMRVWDGNHREEWSVTSDLAPNQARFTPDGLAVIGGVGHRLSKWEALTGELRWEGVSKHRVQAVCAITNSSFVARTTHEVLIYDCVSEKCVASYPAPIGLPTLAVHPLSGAVYAGGENMIRTYSASAALNQMTVEGMVTAIAVDSSSGLIQFASRNAIQQFDADNQPELAVPGPGRPLQFDFASAPQVAQSEEPMWPIASAYGGFAGMSTAIIVSIAANSGSSLAAAAGQVALNAVIGFVIGVFVGLAVGVIKGSRKL